VAEGVGCLSSKHGALSSKLSTNNNNKKMPEEEKAEYLWCMTDLKVTTMLQEPRKDGTGCGEGTEISGIEFTVQK
jgi:hypothetical protein